MFVLFIFGQGHTSRKRWPWPVEPSGLLFVEVFHPWCFIILIVITTDRRRRWWYWISLRSSYLYIQYISYILHSSSSISSLYIFSYKLSLILQIPIIYINILNSSSIMQSYIPTTEIGKPVGKESDFKLICQSIHFNISAQCFWTRILERGKVEGKRS